LQKKIVFHNVTTILPGRNGLVGSPKGTGWGNIPDSEELDCQANQFQLKIIGNGGLTEVFRLTENSNILKDNFMLNLAA
jgi:hypothetical protein